MVNHVQLFFQSACAENHFRLPGLHFLFYELLNSLFCGIPVVCHTIAIDSCPSIQINCKVCAIELSPCVPHIYPLVTYFSSSFQIRKLKILSHFSAVQFQCQHSNIFFQLKQKGKGKMRKRKRKQIRFCQMTNSKAGFSSLLKQ